jgi:tetratricopeptide (TPR) repeat protein
MKVTVFFCLFLLGFSFSYAQDADLRSLSIDELTKRIEKEPRNDALYTMRAFKYAEIERFPEALNDVMRAIEINPGNSENWNIRGWLYFATGQFEKSISNYMQILDLFPGMAYKGLYDCFLVMGEFDKALVYAEKLVEIETENDESYLDRALAYEFTGDFSKATADFDKAIELNPHNGYAFYLRGSFYSDMLEMYEKALLDFDTAIRLDAGSAGAWSGRAYVHFRLKNYQKSVDDMTMFISLAPKLNWQDIEGHGKAYTALAEQTENEKQKAELLKKAGADYAWARELGWDGVE